MMLSLLTFCNDFAPQLTLYLCVCKITRCFSFMARRHGGDLAPCIQKSQSSTTCNSFQNHLIGFVWSTNKFSHFYSDFVFVSSISSRYYLRFLEILGQTKHSESVFVGKLAWNGVVNDLRRLCAHSPPRKHNHKWRREEVKPFLSGGTIYYKSMVLSLLISCNVFAPKEHFTYAFAK